MSLMALFTQTFTAAVGFTAAHTPARRGVRGFGLLAAIWRERAEQDSLLGMELESTREGVPARYWQALR